MYMKLGDFDLTVFYFWISSDEGPLCGDSVSSYEWSGVSGGLQMFLLRWS